jgi:predicted hotdog family 3-hydroxylacyl-ACP dehydratase
VLIDKDRIAQLIPHASGMCLLDGVQSWDEFRIRCTTSTHRSPGNPLRRNGLLGILCGIEYAAQAMAVHAALIAPGSANRRRGYLASLRAASCHTDRLDLVPGTLIVEAESLHLAANGAVYAFALLQESQCLIEGRAVVVIEENQT